MSMVQKNGTSNSSTYRIYLLRNVPKPYTCYLFKEV